MNNDHDGTWVATTPYPATTHEFSGTLTNDRCTCDELWDEEDLTHDEHGHVECWGACYEAGYEDLREVLNPVLARNTSGWWRVDNLRLWNGDVSGYFHATDFPALLRGMTVDSGWVMRWTLSMPSLSFSYSLSHHDAPMGSNSTLTAVSETLAEDLSLRV